MSSITFKIVDLVDKSKIQKLFIENNNNVYFSPIKIKLNLKLVEKIIDSVINVDGKEYKANQFEKDVLEDLDF